MQPTIGIDLVEIARFEQWNTYSDKQLRKVFSDAEIGYCRSVPTKSAERFAVRFAAKEALFKALSPHAIKIPVLFSFLKAVEVDVTHCGVQLKVDWRTLQENYHASNTSSITIQTSLSHTHTTACAVVMIYSFT